MLLFFKIIISTMATTVLYHVYYTSTFARLIVARLIVYVVMRMVALCLAPMFVDPYHDRLWPSREKREVDYDPCATITSMIIDKGRVQRQRKRRLSLMGRKKGIWSFCPLLLYARATIDYDKFQWVDKSQLIEWLRLGVKQEFFNITKAKWSFYAVNNSLL